MNVPQVLDIQCVCCKKVHTIEIPSDAYNRYIQGEFIQQAWPEGSLDDKELLISKVCGKCFDELFPEE